MGLTRLSINRPVFILMVITAMVVMGAVSYKFLNVELYPSISVPVVTIVTPYSGAGSEDIERLVTRPIEDAVAGAPDVDVVSSTSAEGRSQVTVTFTERAQLDLAATDLERRVSGMRGVLPPEAGQSSVLKFDFSQLPVLLMTYSGDLPLDQLFQVAKDQIKPRLEAQSGVGAVTLTGGRAREVQVLVDPYRLQTLGLSIDQISAALTRENQAVPGGAITEGNEQTGLRFYGLWQSVEDIKNTTVTSRSGVPVRVQSVAEVVETFKTVSTRTFFNGREAIGITITKQSSANEIATVDAVRAELAAMRDSLPAGTELFVVSDTSTFTRRSLTGVERSLMEAVVLTALVLLVFLHTVRSTAIVLFAIPTSLVSTFIVMNFLDFTLNIMSSMALVLVVGVLVDDSIVVLENIARHLELGENPMIAAMKGRSEIGMAAIAITLVDVVVFTPVAFLSGTVGSFFRQFGLVIAAATLLSLFISFTLTPMLASRWLSESSLEPGHGPWGRLVRQFERLLDGLRSGYARVLRWSLAHRKVPVGFAFVALAGSFALVPLGLVKFEFVPQSDNGIATLTVELPHGSTLDATEAALRQVEAAIAATPEVDFFQTTSGAGAGGLGGGGGARFGNVQITLVARGQRARTAAEVAQDLTQRTASIPGATVRSATAGGGGGQPVSLQITGDDPGELRRIGSEVELLLAALPGVQNLTNSATEGSPETRLAPDRARMADLGVSAQQAGLALRMGVDGVVATKLRPQNGEEVDVRLIANEATRASLDRASQMPLLATTASGVRPVTLGQITRTESTAGPSSISRRDRQRTITVGAGLAPGVVLNDVTIGLARELTRINADPAIVPPGYAVTLGGQAQQQTEAFSNLFLALGLSIGLEYMLLAALYESMILPFATMVALPVAMVGALLALMLTGNTLNLLSFIGVIVLMGLVGKNGILLVDYINTLRRQGMDREAAILTAGPTRLRPILMTTLALVFGMMPLALGLEEGSETYTAMATVIIGGMISSTLLSLVIVPCVYTYFDDLQICLVAVWRWRPLRGAALVRVAAPAPGPAQNAIAGPYDREQSQAPPDREEAAEAVRPTAR